MIDDTVALRRGVGATVSSRAARGDLTRDGAVRADDAIGRLGDGLHQFPANQRGNIQMIGQHALGLVASSEELTMT